jgi:hypothetical protein
MTDRAPVCACQAGGYFGVATGAIAWYVATAELTNEVYRKVSVSLTYEVIRWDVFIVIGQAPHMYVFLHDMVTHTLPNMYVFFHDMRARTLPNTFNVVHQRSSRALLSSHSCVPQRDLAPR